MWHALVKVGTDMMARCCMMQSHGHQGALGDRVWLHPQLMRMHLHWVGRCHLSGAMLCSSAALAGATGDMTVGIILVPMRRGAVLAGPCTQAVTRLELGSWQRSIFP